MENLASDPAADRSVAESLDRVARALTSELELDVIVQCATDEATKLSGAQFGAFFYNVENATGESYMLYTISGVPREAFSKFPMPRNTDIFAPTFKGEGVVRLDDVTQDPRYGKNEPYRGMPPGHLPVRSYLAVPVKSRSGEVIGGLLFGHEEPGVFSERSEKLVGSIALHTAIAVENARLYRQAKEQEALHRLRARHALLTAEVGTAVTHEGQLDSALQKSCESIVRNLDAAFARVWLVDEVGTTLLLRASAGLYTHLDGGHARVPVGSFKIGLIARERRPHLTNDVAQDPRVGDRAWAGRESLVSFAGYPLVVGERLVGVVAMFARAPLSEAVLGALASVSDVLAVAIERNRAEQEQRENQRRTEALLAEVAEQARSTEAMLVELRARTEEQRYLAEASAILGASLDVQRTLVDVARTLVPRLADWCAIDLVDDDGTLQRAAVEHVDPTKVELAWRLWKLRPPAADSPYGAVAVMRTRQPELLSVTDEMIAAAVPEPDILEIVRSLGLRSSICVPLVARDRVLGALSFVTAESGKVYGQRDVAFATEVASRISIAIDNARLYEAATHARNAAEAMASEVVEQSKLAEAELLRMRAERDAAIAELRNTKSESST